MQAVTHSPGVLQAQCPLFEEAVEDLIKKSAIMEKHQRLGPGRPTKAVKGALKIGSRLVGAHSDIELRTAAKDMGFDVSAASRSDLAEMIAAGVVEGAGVDVRGWGRGGKKGGVRKRNGRGTGRARGRGRGTGRSRGRGRGFEAPDLPAAAGDIHLRGMELDSAADLAGLGGDDGGKLSHTDLSSPAQPWAGTLPVAVAEATPGGGFS